jgi:2-polyprenyl-3-methyl-5-hydroxy-6-metoxy-1,4-benzoquinol methylase
VLPHRSPLPRPRPKNMLQSLSLWLRRVLLRDQAARWDRSYARGRWENLKSPREHMRLDACVEMIRRHAAGGDLLEIGCGEALLQQRLNPGDYRRFVGTDISAVAVGRAQAFANERVSYLVADMRVMELPDRFEAVIFNESINHVSECDRVLRHHARHLRQEGVVVISMFRNKRSGTAWEKIHREARTVDRVTTTNEVGTWDCEVLRLR